MHAKSGKYDILINMFYNIMRVTKSNNIIQFIINSVFYKYCIWWKIIRRNVSNHTYFAQANLIKRVICRRQQRVKTVIHDIVLLKI